MKEQLLSDYLIEALHIALNIVNKHQNKQKKEGSSQEEKWLSDLVLHIDDILEMAVKKDIIGPDEPKRWRKELRKIMHAALSVSHESEVTGCYMYSVRT